MGNTAEINEMLDFGEYVATQGIDKLIYCKENNSLFVHKRNLLIKEKRLAVVNIIHGFELIFKAILLNKDYLINKLKINYPLKNDVKIKNIINTELTIEFSLIIDFIRSEYGGTGFEELKRLNKIRNQIQHRGTRIDRKERNLFIEVFNLLQRLYGEEFPKRKRFVRYLEKNKDRI